MTTATGPPTPRLASTVVPLRDGSTLEVLMLRRHAAVEFAGDAWVFPGGTVDPADRSLSPRCWHGIDTEALAGRFAVPGDLVLGFHVAAVRELFEEAGLLLATCAGGNSPDLSTPEVAAVRSEAAARDAKRVFHDWLAAQGLVLDLSELTYLSRWVTPSALPKRFDATFFLTRAPLDQVAAHDRVETTAGRWLDPRVALAEHAAGSLPMMYPTRRTLEWLAGFGDVAAALDAAASQVEIRTIEPRAEQGPGGLRIIEDVVDRGRSSG